MQAWIQTYSGIKFDLVFPQPEMVSIMDIAVALSRIPRFAGHTKYPYTVAQHCVCTSQICDPEFAMEALLHDASEAYTGDVTSPLKRLLRPEFDRIEKNVEGAIARKFNLQYPWPENVTEADDLLCRYEAHELLKDPPVDGWAGPRFKLHFGFSYKSEEDVRAEFLLRFKQLEETRTGR